MLLLKKKVIQISYKHLYKNYFFLSLTAMFWMKNVFNLRSILPYSQQASQSLFLLKISSMSNS